MKKLAAYYLLLLYTASVCKPVAIWFADEMAHSYFGHQHAAVVHKEGGNRHVHYQIGKAAKDDAPEEKANTSKANEDVTVGSVTASLHRTERLLPAKKCSFRTKRLPFFFYTPPPPPPWA